MADQDNDNQDGNCTGCGRPLKDARTFAELREKLESAEERAEKLSNVALSSGIQAAGFELVDEQGSENKLLSLVTREFVKEHPNVENFDSKSFVEFAKGYGIEPKAAQGAEGAEGGGEGASGQSGSGQPDPLVEAQRKADGLAGATTDTQPSGVESELAEAHAQNDQQKVRQLETQRLMSRIVQEAQ